MTGEPHFSAAAHPDNVAAVGDVEDTREALRHGPRGAFTIASVTVAILFLGWIAFYFLLFMPRGAIR